MGRVLPDKTVPQHIEAEMAVLGGMILDENAASDVIYKLSQDIFYRAAHKKIYAAMVALYDENRPIDIITLTDKLRVQGELERAGGAAYLTTLLNSVSSASNLDQYASILHEKAILRTLITVSQDVAQECFDADVDVGNLIDRVEQRVFDISQKRIDSDFVPIGTLVKESVMTVQNLYNKKTLLTGIPSGYRDLDDRLSGLQRSDLIVMAARPSMGKTSLALGIAENVGVVDKRPVALFSLEMSKEQLVMRMLCSLARINMHKVRRGFLGENDFPELVKAAGKLAAAPIFIDDTPGLSVMELRAKARRLKMKSKIELIAIDYLQLIQSTARRSENRQQEITEISRSLKALARELDVPVIVLSQLNRAVESRQDHKPMLSDLRESGAIEQDADVVLMLMRREYYDREDSPGTADIIIAKQRNGPTGEIRMAFHQDYTRFEDLTQRPEDVEALIEQQ